MSLSAVKQMRENKITHILSVLPEPVELKNADEVKHLVIAVDDVDDENLMKHFAQTNAFIQDAVDKNESVLVHCQAGISRSVTVACAYIMQDQKMTPAEALKLVQTHRKVANPNPGFMQQLDIYYQCGYKVSTDEPLYRRYLLKMEAERAIEGQAPEDIAYASAKPDEKVAALAEKPLTQLKCKKCRIPLALSTSFILHPPKDSDPADANYAPRNGMAFNSAIPPSCMHYYLEPVLWMKPELDQGHLEGKLLCPKCHGRLGAYHWQGEKCSCGRWITPAIEIQRSKVDEEPVRRKAGL